MTSSTISEPRIISVTMSLSELTKSVKGLVIISPHWKVPLVFMDAEYSIEIDFTEYESVATVSRAFLTVSFLIGLLFITRRLMHND